jgi:hypothetical protein
VHVPNENSVQPTSHAIPGDELQSRSSLRPQLSPANEVRRSTGVQGSTVPDTDFKAPGEAARNLVDGGGFSGSPSFVAVQKILHVVTASIVTPAASGVLD